MTAEETPELLRKADVRRTYGLGRHDADRVFSLLPTIRIPDSTKAYVRRDDLEALIASYAQPPAA